MILYPATLYSNFKMNFLEFLYSGSCHLWIEFGFTASLSNRMAFISFSCLFTLARTFSTILKRRGRKDFQSSWFRESVLPFTIKYDVICVCVSVSVSCGCPYYVEVLFLVSWIFIMKGYWILSGCFYCGFIDMIMYFVCVFFFF